MGKSRIHAAIIIALLLSISGLHFFTSVYKSFYHDLFDRLYYIPIILSSFFFGLRGGAVVAIVSGTFLFIHLRMQWQMFFPVEIMGKYLEIALYIVVGVITGFLSDLERKSQRKTEEAYKKLSQSFEKAKEAARLAAIGKVSAGVAHEIRNPLGGMKGAMEVISSDYKPDHPKFRFVKIIEKEIGRVNRIVEDFLNFARPRKPELAPTNLNHLLSSVLYMNEKAMNKKNISHTCSFDESLPISFLDSNKIKQVFLNVILNGMDSMPDGGELELISRRFKKTLEVLISDTGQGVNQENEAQLFEPFFTTRPKGTGMGLAISKQIVDQHGGKISINNRTDGRRGATVKIIFPIREEK